MENGKIVEGKGHIQGFVLFSPPSYAKYRAEHKVGTKYKQFKLKQKVKQDFKIL